MMKKLLVLMLVLGITSVANAGMLDLVIVSKGPGPDTTVPIPPTSSITLLPSEWIDIDVVYHNDEGWYLFGMSGTIEMTGQGTGEFVIDDLTWPEGIWDFAAAGETYMSGMEIEGDGDAGLWTSAKGDGLPADGSTEGVIVVDHILFHCTGLGDVIIQLVLNDVWPPAETWEYDINVGELFEPGISAALTIHQIPEPMTVALLGLGGLFLLRRRR